MGAHALYRVNSSESGELLKVAKIHPVHEPLYCGFKEQLHPRDSDHSAHVLIDPAGFLKHLLVKQINCASVRCLEGTSKYKGQDCDAYHNSDEEEHPDSEKVGACESRFCHQVITAMTSY